MRSAATKRCPKCGETKPLEAFSPHRGRADGLDVNCRVCNAERMRRKRARHMAAGRCADCGQPRGDSRSARFCSRCLARYPGRGTSTTRLRDRVLRAYSDDVPSCACCGESTPRFLTLDHIDNGGRAHRRRYNGWQGVFRELVRDGFPPGYRVLCFNCNLARGAYGACPHQGPVDHPPGPIKPRKLVLPIGEPGAHKRCTYCRQDLPFAEFYPDKGTRLGLQSRCRTCTRDASLNRLHEARHEALLHYSGGELKCACCGEHEETFLVLDHINGGGPRPPATCHGGNPFYAWLAREGFPPGLRVLCHSCNCAMGRGRTCPHELARDRAR